MTDPLDIIMVTAKMALALQDIMNVYHTVSTGAHDDPDAAFDITTALDGVYDLVDALIANNLTFDSIALKNITGGYDIGEFDWPNLMTGAGSAEYLPSGVAALITLPTAKLKTRGRKFFGGTTEAINVDGLWDSTAMTALTSAGAALSQTFIGVETGDPYSWGVVDEAGLYWPHQSAVITNVPAYQRRRKPGVGS